MNIEIEKKEMPYFFWLCGIKGFGDKTVKSLLDICPIPSRIYYSSEDLVYLWKSLGILNESQAETLEKAKKTGDIYSPYNELKNKNIDIIPITNKDYPKKLKEIPDAPAALYVRGQLPQEREPLLAIVGARDCSPYGRRAAEYFANAMAKEGVGIISGMARGIDGIAQRSCLAAEGRSYGVLGCGVDICYPPQNKDLYLRLPKQGALISSYVPGTSPKPMLFPARNRIISALSDGILVIEARMKSGSKITVDMALEQGKDVFAVPGRIDDPLSLGCNDLIKQGAGIADCAQTILEALFNQKVCSKSPEEIIKERLKAAIEKMPSDEGIILCILCDDPKSLEEILSSAEEQGLKLTASSLRQILIRLSIRGYVCEVAGRFIRSI